MNNTPNPDQRGAMVADALKVLNPSFGPQQISDGELIIKKSMEVSKAVAALCREIDSSVQAKGTKHDVKALAQMISRLYREAFMEFSKDELIYLLTFMHTDIAVDAMTGSTETAKIITPN